MLIHHGDDWVNSGDPQGIGPKMRKVAIAIDGAMIVALIGASIWIGQQSTIIEEQGKKITAQGVAISELTAAVEAMPEKFVATRSIDDYIDRRVQSVVGSIRAELEAFGREQSRTKTEVRAIFELSMQARIRDLQREACSLHGGARRTLELEVQDLRNRYSNVTGREYVTPACEALK